MNVIIPVLLPSCKEEFIDFISSQCIKIWLMMLKVDKVNMSDDGGQFKKGENILMNRIVELKESVRKWHQSLKLAH